MPLPKFPGACAFAEISGRRVSVFFVFCGIFFFSPQPGKTQPGKKIARARKKKKKKKNESHG